MASTPTPTPAPLVADLPGLPEWLDLVVKAGTLITLLGALLVYAQAQRDRQRAQARLVYCWIRAADDAADDGEFLTELIMKNASTEPVWDAYAYSTRVVAERTGEAFLPPGEQFKETGVSEMIELLGSGSLGDDLIFVFRDAAGRRWIREHSRLRRAHWWWFRHGVPRSYLRALNTLQAEDQGMVSG